MSRVPQQVAARLSLRKPQKESLDILADVADHISLRKGADVGAALRAVQAQYPKVEEFEREFPSLCFALATGVGKTRLMGAFVAYLYLAKGVRNFFVVAPNLTIYEKLKADFTPNTPKYVLDGIAEFAVNPPVIITGDDYEQGRGVRGGELFDNSVHINIFNISKINAEVRDGKEPRIKRLQEYIGTSYFEYLAQLPDLVLLMDESHRYRASAGVRALNELRPVLGLELTATPQVEKGSKVERFKNIIYDYPLGRALDDGLVKRPAVATRENFDPSHYDEAKLERLKLEDGIRIHETVKVELAAYASRHEKALVKPFVLVVAQDTTHADTLLALIKGEDFFEGRYRDKVITVHSNQRGEEKDDTVQALLRVEDPAEPTEVVIHVNKLGEGWDVKNLYTIVPLRAANSKTLVEQSIGRGLRLPYGVRTGDAVVDRLTIVAHDHFQEIIDEANKPGSVLHWDQVVIGRDMPEKPKVGVELPAPFEAMISGEQGGAIGEQQGGGQQETLVFQEGAEQQIARATADVVTKHFQHLSRSADLRNPEVMERLVKAVERTLAPSQLELTVEERPNIALVVERAVRALELRNIDIPKITVVPTGEVACGFRDFDMTLGPRGWEPVPDDILIQHLRSNERTTLASGSGASPEEQPENYIIRNIINFDDVAYERDGALLYKLAGQMVAHLRGYLPEEDAVVNVLQYHEQGLAEFIHRQMQPQYWEHAVAYEARVHDGFEVLRGRMITGDGTSVRSFRETVKPLSDVPKIRFGHFKKNLYNEAKFDSDPERRLAVLLEDSKEVLKWFRPEGPPPRIDWADGRGYEPDFVVETDAEKLLFEVKAENEMEDPEVLAKAKAAMEWCVNATKHAQAHAGKPWSYILVPDTAVTAAATLNGLKAKFGE